MQAVLEVGGADPESSRGIISALGWLPYEQAEGTIKKLLASDSPDLRCIGITASANHRHDPGRPLMEALTDKEPYLKARALKAVGELGRLDLLIFLRNSFTDKDDRCRFYAAWSASILGDHSAVVVLKSFLVLPQFAEVAVKLALRRMDLESAHSWQKELAQNPETLRLALIGAGAIGDPILIPWLIEQMETPAFARVAGEAFTMITGVDIAYEDLEGERPEDFETGPTENPEDENVEMDPDEDLP